MEKKTKTRVNLDGLHSLDVSVDEEKKTVIAELVVADEKSIFIYAEKFDTSCNYLKAAIKKGMLYLSGESNAYKKTSDIRQNQQT